MKVIIKYIAIDPYYSDTIQTFIGESMSSIESQICEYEQYVGREHSMGISAIYKTETLSNNHQITTP